MPPRLVQKNFGDEQDEKIKTPVEVCLTPSLAVILTSYNTLLEDFPLKVVLTKGAAKLFSSLTLWAPERMAYTAIGLTTFATHTVTLLTYNMEFIITYIIRAFREKAVLTRKDIKAPQDLVV